ncbi:MAG: hypothetical protein ACLR2E_18240 [Lachnospiraceae bacterium]
MKLILILGAAFLLLFLLERGYRRFWSRDLHVEVHFQPHPAREGEEATLTEIIENRKVLPVPMLQVEFLLDRSLGIDEEENASLPTSCIKGTFSLYLLSEDQPYDSAEMQEERLLSHP